MKNFKTFARHFSKQRTKMSHSPKIRLTSTEEIRKRLSNEWSTKKYFIEYDSYFSNHLGFTQKIAINGIRSLAHLCVSTRFSVFTLFN